MRGDRPPGTPVRGALIPPLRIPPSVPMRGFPMCDPSSAPYPFFTAPRPMPACGVLAIPGVLEEVTRCVCEPHAPICGDIILALRIGAVPR